MDKQVAIIGVGFVKPSKTSSQFSYKELMYEAAKKAYQDANIEPKDVDSFISVSEDLIEGTSIFDEYVPDQLGARQKSVHSISADGIVAFASAYMQIASGEMDLIVCEGHSKASNILTLPYIINYALDPVLQRPLNLHPYYIAGLEMQKYLDKNKISREQCAQIVVNNKKHALTNDLACFGKELTIQDVLDSKPIASPLNELDISSHVDGAYVFVLASKKYISKNPIWITGLGWNSDTPSLETRNWEYLESLQKAARQTYTMAAIKNPKKEIDIFEIDDTFSYKQLQHMENLNLGKPKEAYNLIQDNFPVNLSGGTLGVGHMHEATGLHKTLEIVRALRGDVSRGNIKKPKRALAHSWRGLPTTSHACVILETE